VVNLYERNNPSASVLVFDVISVSTDNTVILFDNGYGSYASYGTSTEYIMTFQDYDNCQSCQKKFVFFADDDEKIGSVDDLGQRWI
jgi:hypothetical protein